MVSAGAAQCPSVMQTPGSDGHSLSAAQARQTFVVSQMGFVAVVQSVFITHATQAPEDAQTRTGPPSGWAQSMAPAQARQLFVVASHTGFGALSQSMSSAHSTHFPDEAQTGVPASAPPHSLAPVQPRQIFVVPSQIGFVPEQE